MESNEKDTNVNALPIEVQGRLYRRSLKNPGTKAGRLFSAEQLVGLKESYDKNSYPSKAEYTCLARKLEMKEKSVRMWFQNRRALLRKGKRLEEEQDFQMDQGFLKRRQLIEPTPQNIKEFYEKYLLTNCILPIYPPLCDTLTAMNYWKSLVNYDLIGKYNSSTFNLSNQEMISPNKFCNWIPLRPTSVDCSLRQDDKLHCGTGSITFDQLNNSLDKNKGTRCKNDEFYSEVDRKIATRHEYSNKNSTIQKIEQEEPLDLSLKNSKKHHCFDSEQAS